MSCFTYSLGIYGHTKLVQLTTAFTVVDVDSDIGTCGKVYGEIQSACLSKGTWPLPAVVSSSKSSTQILCHLKN